jgi:hypothetical protein
LECDFLIVLKEVLKRGDFLLELHQLVHGENRVEGYGVFEGVL